jgi:hypothetical protein
VGLLQLVHHWGLNDSLQIKHSYLWTSSYLRAPPITGWILYGHVDILHIVLQGTYKYHSGSPLIGSALEYQGYPLYYIYADFSVPQRTSSKRLSIRLIWTANTLYAEGLVRTSLGTHHPSGPKELLDSKKFVKKSVPQKESIR